MAAELQIVTVFLIVLISTTLRLGPHIRPISNGG